MKWWLYSQSSNRLLNHSSSSTTSPWTFISSFAWKATSIETFCPSWAPNIAPTMGPVCWRIVWRVMQSDIVRSTSGCNCTEGEPSDARVVEMSGFCEAPTMPATTYCSISTRPMGKLGEIIVCWSAALVDAAGRRSRCDWWGLKTS